jgi:hypothetical protein
MHVGGTNTVTATFTPDASLGFAEGSKTDVVITVDVKAKALTATLNSGVEITTTQNGTATVDLTAADVTVAGLPEGVTVDTVKATFSSVAEAGDSVAVSVAITLTGTNNDDYTVTAIAATGKVEAAEQPSESPDVSTSPDVTESQTPSESEKPSESQTPSESEQPSESVAPSEQPSESVAPSQNPGTEEVPGAELIDENEVSVVLKSYTLKSASKTVKPTVYVYTSTGTKLASKNYTVNYTNNGAAGDYTLTVTLGAGSTYTFSNGTTTSDEVAYKIVNAKTDMILTTATKITANYGDAVSVSAAKATVKVGGKKVAAQITMDLDDITNADGTIDAGVYTVTVAATYGDNTVYAQVPLTVKAKKVSVKTVKLDDISASTFTGLDDDDIKAVLAEKITDKLVADGTLADGSFSVEVTKYTSLAKSGKKTVTYTLTLDDTNLTFTSGKSVLTKSLKASVKIG